MPYGNVNVNHIMKVPINGSIDLQLEKTILHKWCPRYQKKLTFCKGMQIMLLLDDLGMHRDMLHYEGQWT